MIVRLMLVSLVAALDVYIVTDGTDEIDASKKQDWRNARNWLEYIFEYSGILDHTDTQLHLIDSRERISHCSGSSRCRSRIHRLRMPHFNTYATLRYLSEVKADLPTISKSILLFLTDGDIGADIEANCLTNPKHSLFQEEDKHCTEFFMELLNAMDNYASLRSFDSLFLLSWNRNDTIPSATGKMIETLFEPRVFVSTSLSNKHDRFSVILELMRSLAEEVTQKQNVNLKAKLIEKVSEH